MTGHHEATPAPPGRSAPGTDQDTPPDLLRGRSGYRASSTRCRCKVTCYPKRNWRTGLFIARCRRRACGWCALTTTRDDAPFLARWHFGMGRH
jgi:hypothetical protein